VVKVKITLASGLLLIGTVVAAVGIVVNEGYLSTSFTLGLTATDFGLIAGFMYLIGFLVWLSEKYLGHRVA
jgi:hypothetical protein